MDRKLLLVFAAGIILGIAFAEVYYILTAPLVLPDNSITVVTDQGYFDRAADILDNAKRSIHIVMFSMQRYTSPEHWDSSTNRLLESLVSAKTRGVKIRVIMDDWPEGNDRTYEYLDEKGIEVRMTYGFEGSTHCKLLIIDGEIVLVGSSNWSYYSVDMNHEANVIVRSRDVAGRFTRYFDDLWASTSGSPGSPSPVS